MSRVADRDDCLSKFALRCSILLKEEGTMCGFANVLAIGSKKRFTQNKGLEF